MQHLGFIMRDLYHVMLYMLYDLSLYIYRCMLTMCCCFYIILYICIYICIYIYVYIIYIYLFIININDIYIYVLYTQSLM